MHDVPSAPTGLGQDAHDVVPQESVLPFMAQMPLQSCVPLGHEPEQAAAAAIQAPAHSF